MAVLGHRVNQLVKARIYEMCCDIKETLFFFFVFLFFSGI